jgi:predicted SprT family Zn-dependent metalloprotease
MTQKVGGTDRKLKAILLNINLCEEASYLKNFLKYVRQIFIHELAHYLYYFKDYAPEQFDNICWKNENNLCDTNDFISTYAQKSKEEDYAESFAYRYLGYLNNKEQEHMSAYPPKMEKKQQHFDEIYA